MEFAAERDGNQAGIARITYLGGLLLPFTAVATVLSMSEPFSPDGNRFWVFWAASIPLTVFTVLLIYADELRRLEVWVEVSADNLQEVGGRDDYDDDDDDRRMSIRVGTAGRGQPLSYHALSEAGPADAADAAEAAEVTDDVQEIVLEVVGAQRRRRFRITNPLGGPHAEVYTQTAPQSSEERLPTHDAPEDVVVINMYARHRHPDRQRPAMVRPRPARPPAPSLQGYTPAGYEHAHSRRPAYVMQAPTAAAAAAADGGPHARAWRRQPLGWLGAAGSLVGLQRPHRMQEMPPGTAAEVKAEDKRRTWKF